MKIQQADHNLDDAPCQIYASSAFQSQLGVRLTCSTFGDETLLLYGLAARNGQEYVHLSASLINHRI